MITLLLLPLIALASPPISSSLTAEIKEARTKYKGLQNVKMVMPGVLYRGGGTGGREPIGSEPLAALCEDGFTSAVYAYKTGWKGDASISCNGSGLRYTYRQWDKPSAAKEFLRDVFEAIQRGNGAVYVHCWYGVHASGYLAAIALKQFCGYDSEKAVAYWNSNVTPSLRYPKVQKMVRDFQPFAEFEVSDQDRAKICQ